MSSSDCEASESDLQHEVDSIKGSWLKTKLFLEQLFSRQGKAEKLILDLISEIKSELKEMITNENRTKTKTSKKKKFKKENIKQEETSTDSSSNDSSNNTVEKTSTEDEECESFSYSSSTLGRKKKRTKRRTVKEDKELSVLEKLLSKLDNRKLHEMEPYDENCGLELSEYLRRFEEYYSKNYKGEKYLWLGVLESKLQGRTLQGFKSVRQDDEGYEKTKRKLLRWHKEETETRATTARKNFDRARMKDGESVSIYCNRLLKLFKMAYPKKNHECNNALLNKLKETVNKKLKNIIQNQIISHKIDDKRITWNKIQKLARIYDIENDLKEDETKESDEDIVVINLSNKNNWHDNEKKEQNKSEKEGNYTRQYRNEEGRNFYKTRENINPNYEEMCKYCGRYGHAYENCRKRLRECFKCGKPNHIARDCYARVGERQRRYSESDRNGSFNNHQIENQSQRTMKQRNHDTQNLNAKAPEWSRTIWRR